MLDNFDCIAHTINARIMPLTWQVYGNLMLNKRCVEVI